MDGAWDRLHAVAAHDHTAAAAAAHAQTKLLLSYLGDLQAEVEAHRERAAAGEAAPPAPLAPPPAPGPVAQPALNAKQREDKLLGVLCGSLELQVELLREELDRLRDAQEEGMWARDMSLQLADAESQTEHPPVVEKKCCGC